MLQKTAFLELFSKEASKADAAPERLALYIAGMAYPELNVDCELHILNQIAERMALALADSPPGKQSAFRFLSVINHEFEFDGNRADYYNVENSYLNIVLERRVGLPLTLGIICMAVGRRLREKGYNITIDGLGLPSHFMTRYEDEAGVWLLDPFNGSVILPSEVDQYLSQLFDGPHHSKQLVLPPEVFKPVSSITVAFRMLNNLRMVFLHEENLLSTIKVLDYMIELMPSDANLWQERALLHYQCEIWSRAERDLRRYFFLNENLIVTLGGADFEISYDEDFSEYTEALDNLSEEDQKLLYILNDIEQIRSRLN